MTEYAEKKEDLKSPHDQPPRHHDFCSKKKKHNGIGVRIVLLSMPLYTDYFT